MAHGPQDVGGVRKLANKVRIVVSLLPANLEKVSTNAVHVADDRSGQRLYRIRQLDDLVTVCAADPKVDLLERLCEQRAAVGPCGGVVQVVCMHLRRRKNERV